MKTHYWIIPLTLILLSAVPVLGQTSSVIGKTAALRSSPSVTGSIVLLEVPRNYPLEVEGESGDFLRVRDYRGQDSWIEKRLVGDGDSVIVKADVANLRSGPGPGNQVVFKARRGVTFRVLDGQSDWLHVEHDSGRQGWIYKALVWGHEEEQPTAQTR